MRNFFIIKEEYINSRLDRWFRRNVQDVPQSFIEKNLRKGKIKVNNKRQKSSYKLKKNDQIKIFNFNFSPKLENNKLNEYKPTKEDLNKTSELFIENNDNFVVINKPAGIAVQSGTKTRKNILDILKGTNEFKYTKPYAVHRIDKETTGVLIVAKNRKFAQLFTTLFRLRKVYKTYICIVLGEASTNKGTFIDDLLYSEGKKKLIHKAITHYTVLDSNNNYSLLKLKPETGRKHQLRKQLLIHGFPILGDTKYRLFSKKRPKNNILMLHAHKIQFFINNKKYVYSANIPAVFMKAIKEKYLKNF